MEEAEIKIVGAGHCPARFFDCLGIENSWIYQRENHPEYQTMIMDAQIIILLRFVPMIKIVILEIVIG